MTGVRYSSSLRERANLYQSYLSDRLMSYGSYVLGTLFIIKGMFEGIFTPINIGVAIIKLLMLYMSYKVRFKLFLGLFIDFMSFPFNIRLLLPPFIITHNGSADLYIARTFWTYKGLIDLINCREFMLTIII